MRIWLGFQNKKIKNEKRNKFCFFFESGSLSSVLTQLAVHCKV